MAWRTRNHDTSPGRHPFTGHLSTEGMGAGHFSPDVLPHPLHAVPRAQTAQPSQAWFSRTSPAVASHQLSCHPRPSSPNFPPNGCSQSWSTPASYPSPCFSRFLYTSTHNTQNVTSDPFRALTRCPSLDLLRPSRALPCRPSTTAFPFLCFESLLSSSLHRDPWPRNAAHPSSQRVTPYGLLSL